MTTQASVLSTIPGYVSGTWDIDPVHSEVSFVVRHMVVSKVRGRFDRFEGTIVTGDDPLQSSVEATINAGSVNTNQDQRDAHIRSADFLDVDNHPEITFRSLAILNSTTTRLRMSSFRNRISLSHRKAVQRITVLCSLVHCL